MKLKVKIAAFIILFGTLMFWKMLPDPLFNVDYAHLLYDRNHQLLGGRISEDGQWRFPPVDSVPYKFEQCIILFEDQYFYKHPGVNPLAIARAIGQNIEAGEIISGASTITMQTIRLSRSKHSRSFKEKFVEMVMALRLECSYSKDEILALYASHAPFGGNTIGLETAAWRYYGTPSNQLSWGESALLAVLPNQPALLYPGRHDSLLLKKRNRLLKTLLLNEVISESTFHLACQEPIPEKPRPLPQIASHMLDRSIRTSPNLLTHSTTLNGNIQTTVQNILKDHQRRLNQNHIHNAAVLLADIHTGEVLTYAGNSATSSKHHKYVDLIRALRSPGSTLKPFLYGAALDEGLILPQSLLPDIPTYYQGFTPKNFALEYDGAVPADKALARSLNIPFVRLLQDYGYPKFNHLLKSTGFSSLTKPSDHYGLSIILGGAEVSLWELTNAYGLMIQKGMGKPILKTLNFNRNNSMNVTLPLSREACWHTLKALMEVNRPGEDGAWKHFVSSQEVAWKTGTSFGFKDAWAIGASPDYIVGIWVGNADGEGRPDLIGSMAAGPILFDVLNILSSRSRFPQPALNLKDILVCNQSGEKAGSYCPDTQIQWLLAKAKDNSFCTYHKYIYINDSGEQVAKQCAKSDNIQPISYFTLPPAQAMYYQRKHPDYNSLPNWAEYCQDNNSNPKIDFIYPAKETAVFIPKELKGNMGRVVFEVAHHQPKQKVFWHLNENFLGVTQHQHKLATHIPKGIYTLTVVDELGTTESRRFEVVSE